MARTLRAVSALLALMGLTWDPPPRVPVPHFDLIMPHPGPTDAVEVPVFSPISGPDSVGNTSPGQAPQPRLVSGPMSSFL